jgi:hypothetical protein
MAVTGCDGWAEAEFPFGIVMASVGRRQVQESWVGVDQVVEFHFQVHRQEVQRMKV